MITYTRTNIFESNAQVLVNTVNTVGVMGKGLAKEFKRLYPDMFESYQDYCNKKRFQIGNLHLYQTKNKQILNFPTKQNWRSASKLEYIELGLKKFVEQYQQQKINSISFPMLGCGNGGLSWRSEIKPLMHKYLRKLPIDVFIHTASKDIFAPEHKDQKQIDKWLKDEPYYLSSMEFISHIRQEYSKLINEVSNSQLNLSIEVLFEDDIICIKNGDITLHITDDTLRDIWQILKNSGILKANMLSFELATHSNMIMLFLSQLEYLTLTQLDDSNMCIRILAQQQPQIKHKQKSFSIV